MLGGLEVQVKAHLIASDVVNFDETGIKVRPPDLDDFTMTSVSKKTGVVSDSPRAGPSNNRPQLIRNQFINQA